MCCNGERTNKKVYIPESCHKKINDSLEEHKDHAHLYNWLHYGFGITKSTISLPARQKHDYIEFVKLSCNFNTYYKCTNSEICNLNDMTAMSHVMAKIRAKFKENEDKELRNLFILFAFEATNNEMGVIRFRNYLNKFIKNYKANPTELYNSYKDTVNEKLIHIPKLCNFLKENPRLLDMHFGAYSIRNVLRDNGKFYATSNRTKPLHAKRDKPKEKSKKDKANNILNRRFMPEFCNYAWVTDITEFEYKRGCKAYLCAIRDIRCGSILGYHVSNNMRTELAINALDNAIKNTGTQPLLLHSDGGKQFTSNEYVTYCQEHCIKRSISRPGKCHDNAKMETFFANLKTEISKESSKDGTKKLSFYSSLDTFKKHVDEYIEYYNSVRLPSYGEASKKEVRSMNLEIFKNDELLKTLIHLELQKAYLESLNRNISTYKVMQELYSYKITNGSNNSDANILA